MHIEMIQRMNSREIYKRVFGSVDSKDLQTLLFFDETYKESNILPLSYCDMIINSQKYQGCSFFTNVIFERKIIGYLMVGYWVLLLILVKIEWFLGKFEWNFWWKILCRFCVVFAIFWKFLKIRWFFGDFWEVVKFENFWKFFEKNGTNAKMAQKWHKNGTRFWPFFGYF